MKNKVSIITTVHLPFDGRIFHKEAKSLANAGYKVTLIAQHNVREKVDEVNIVPLSTPRNRFTRIFGLGLQAFRLALQQKSDIYHFLPPRSVDNGYCRNVVTNQGCASGL